MDKEFELAIQQICDEKGITREVVMDTINAAVASAYRKDYGTPNQRIKADFDPKTGKLKVFRVFEVVEEEDLENEEAQRTLKEAKKENKKAKVGDEIIEKIKNPASDFGRIAAQTAKQVIIQRIREAERTVLFEEFQNKEHSLVNGTVQQIELKSVIVDLGKINGVLPISGQIPGEKYYISQRVKVYVEKVEETTRGPQVMLSRSTPELIRKLFEIEVPEISAETVEIKDIVREPGRRTKMSVVTTQEGVDPVGSCIGQRGTRVQAVLAEIGGEKIDIILWQKDPKQYIINALSPAKIKSVKLIKSKVKAKTVKKTKKAITEEEIQKPIGYQGKAEVLTEADQLSLAIGKDGQNVRLASKLCNWDIDVAKAETELEEEGDAKDLSEKIEAAAKAAKAEKTAKTETPTEIKPSTDGTKSKAKKPTKKKKSARG